jgi:putative nucleotidyltransferase with HDIG domain
MPGMNGLELLRRARGSGCVTPFVMISGLYEHHLALEALAGGATDYLLKPAKVTDILEMAGKHVKPSGPEAPVALEQAATRDLYNLSAGVAAPQLYQLLRSMSDKRVETLSHSCRVAAYAVLLGRAMTARYPSLNLKELELGALLHDIGKVAVPGNVISKCGPLSHEEWRIMKMHPTIGFDMLTPISGMEGVAHIVLHHHEFFDGRGYPQGIGGERIPLGARIFSIVDALDAITADSPYRNARSIAVARREIESASGTQFDPELVEVFLAIAEEELSSIAGMQAVKGTDSPLRVPA